MELDRAEKFFLLAKLKDELLQLQRYMLQPLAEKLDEFSAEDVMQRYQQKATDLQLLTSIVDKLQQDVS